MEAPQGAIALPTPFTDGGVELVGVIQVLKGESVREFKARNLLPRSFDLCSGRRKIEILYPSRHLFRWQRDAQ
jgi:hypothetical protein